MSFANEQIKLAIDYHRSQVFLFFGKMVRQTNDKSDNFFGNDFNKHRYRRGAVFYIDNFAERLHGRSSHGGFDFVYRLGFTLLANYGNSECFERKIFDGKEVF